MRYHKTIFVGLGAVVGLAFLLTGCGDPEPTIGGGIFDTEGDDLFTEHVELVECWYSDENPLPDNWECVADPENIHDTATMSPDN